jgi:hypothetical protein
MRNVDEDIPALNPFPAENGLELCRRTVQNPPAHDCKTLGQAQRKQTLISGVI